MAHTVAAAGAVPHGHYAEESMKVTVVPNRTMILLSLAIAWAVSTRSEAVAYAAHAGDHTIYPDCRPEERNGAFRDLADLCRRVDLRVAGRRTLEAMVKSGCFDSFGKNRATLVNALPAAMQLGEQRTRAVAAGQDDLFGGLAGPVPGHAPSAIDLADVPDWSEAERLQGERETLGLFLSGHPIAEYEAELRQLVPARIADLGGPRPTAETRGFGGGKNVTVAGLVLEIRRRGSRMTLLLDDRSGRIGDGGGRTLGGDVNALMSALSMLSVLTLPCWVTHTNATS